jgi:hypothetical protein
MYVHSAVLQLSQWLLLELWVGGCEARQVLPAAVVQLLGPSKGAPGRGEGGMPCAWGLTLTLGG